MKNQALMYAAAALVIGAAGGFYGGMQYQKTKVPAGAMMFRNGANGSSFQRGTNPNGTRGNRFQVGEVVKADDQSLTVKYPDGSSKLIILSSSTTINKATQGSKTDLQPGIKVLIMGTANSDGSEIAQNIQINPAQGFQKQ